MSGNDKNNVMVDRGSQTRCWMAIDVETGAYLNLVPLNVNEVYELMTENYDDSKVRKGAVKLEIDMRFLDEK